ncbi:diguanylate cyclase [Shewanella sp. Isolate11]|uniref:GGDEF domain-containing response regulator n=1 Tax=Shewanella sp. Isolate11 TaxID=2908530 RepID=UPI001EFE1EEE|nr:diguanylate cyclase [Shewanella sp. Isolate11]MCG9698422.1 diguanylate cyclase [Shewanella sp. Isolate11]
MNKLSVVLVVDDVKTNVLNMEQCLQDQYQVWAADNGESCLLAAKQQPDLILLNMLTSKLDPYRLCRQLKASPETSDIPIILISTNNSEAEQKGLALGAADCISKPISPAVVRARVSTHIQLKQHQQQLKYMAFHDQLTGLYNRHFLAERASQSLANMVRHHGELSLLMIDLDYFKQINEFNGHQVGDVILQQVGRLLQQSFRKEDMVARLGGEAFVVMMELGLYQARAKAELIRQKLQQLKPLGVEVTGSFGLVVANIDNADFAHLLLLADEAVYKAKADGRNRLVCYQQGQYLCDD